MLKSYLILLLQTLSVYSKCWRTFNLFQIITQFRPSNTISTLWYCHRDLNLNYIRYNSCVRYNISNDFFCPSYVTEFAKFRLLFSFLLTLRKNNSKLNYDILHKRNVRHVIHFVGPPWSEQRRAAVHRWAPKRPCHNMPPNNLLPLHYFL